VELAGDFVLLFSSMKLGLMFILGVCMKYGGMEWKEEFGQGLAEDRQHLVLMPLNRLVLMITPASMNPHRFIRTISPRFSSCHADQWSRGHSPHGAAHCGSSSSGGGTKEI
jgi:hypothetical protein